MNGRRVKSGIRTLSRPIVTLGVYSSLAAALVLTSMADHRPNADQAPGRGRVHVEVREIYDFPSLAEMVATADAVVVGTVRSSRSGRILGEPENPLLMTESTVVVDEVLHGSVAGDVVVVESQAILFEQTWAQDVPWMRIGATSVLFLRRKSDGATTTYYAPISRQGILVVGGNGSLSGAIPDPLVDRLDDLRLAEVRASVGDASTRAQRGEIEPLQPAVPPR